jgi:hypothetical protein
MYEPLTNFYADIPNSRLSMVESPYFSANMTQNSLMASPPYMLFWLHYLSYFIDIAKSRNGPVAYWTSVYAAQNAKKGQGTVMQRNPVHVMQCRDYQRDSKNLPPSNESFARCGDLCDTKRSPKGIHWGTYSWTTVFSRTLPPN